MSSDPAAPPTSAGVQDAKRRLRAAARKARAAAAQAGAGGAAEALRDVAMAVLAARLNRPRAVVSAYWPMGDEIDPRPLLQALGERGCTLALPAIRAAGQPLDFRAWRPGDPLQPAGFGTSEPLPSAPLVQPGLLLVPLLAFDAAGYRLGYGGGFYDRSLALLRGTGDILAVGLAYAAQQVAEVPRESTDQPLDLVATETGVVTPEPDAKPE